MDINNKYHRTIIKLLKAIVLCLFCCGCNLINESYDDAGERIFNSMSVKLNGQVYSLTDVVGNTEPLFGGPLSCQGIMLGKKLLVEFKADDTIKVGTRHTNPNGSFWSYDAKYDQYEGILNSGEITSKTYTFHGGTRVQGSFSFTTVVGNDTLKFTEGVFDVSLE